MSTGKILVTGATGFVGRALISAAAARGIDLRATVRTHEPARVADLRSTAEVVCVGNFVGAIREVWTLRPRAE